MSLLQKKITNNRRTSITEVFVVPENGWIENVSCVAEGDPEGEYSINIYIDEKYIQRFDFKVKLPAKFLYDQIKFEPPTRFNEEKNNHTIIPKRSTE